MGAHVKVNPISHLVSADRDLANSAHMSAQAGWSLVACVVVIAVFAPLPVRTYKRHL